MLIQSDFPPFKYKPGVENSLINMSNGRKGPLAAFPSSVTRIPPCAPADEHQKTMYVISHQAQHDPNSSHPAWDKSSNFYHFSLKYCLHLNKRKKTIRRAQWVRLTGRLGHTYFMWPQHNVAHGKSFDWDGSAPSWATGQQDSIFQDSCSNPPTHRTCPNEGTWF